MPPATSLVPMTEAQLADYLRRAIPDYARDKVASGQWTEAEAMERSRKSYAELLPEGVATPDQHLYVMHDEHAIVVGELWIGEQEQAGRRVAFVYDVAVHPEHRRKGHAARAFQALEGVVSSLGLAGIGLHVFGHNSAARALYLKLGYLETNVNMFKALDQEARRPWMSGPALLDDLERVQADPDLKLELDEMQDDATEDPDRRW